MLTAIWLHPLVCDEVHQASLCLVPTLNVSQLRVGGLRHNYRVNVFEFAGRRNFNATNRIL